MMGHQPVLWREMLSLIDLRGSFLDCTFGGGGHSRKLLESSNEISVTALDCDPAATERAVPLQIEFPNRFRFYDLSYTELDKIEESGFTGVLMDLGVSSFQLDEIARGFSFRGGERLDMRFDPRKGSSAAEFLESASREELIRAIRDFGEEPSWRSIVEAIEKVRGTGSLQNPTIFADLVVGVKENSEKKKRRGSRRSSLRFHPATLTFQGIRIAVNRELEALEVALPKAFERLAHGGILLVISFHSLEDRIVKRFFRRMAGLPEHKGDGTPQQMRSRFATLITTRPIVASELEKRENPRSRSAKLRALYKGTEIITKTKSNG